MAQGQLVRVSGIAEAHVLKVHAAAFHCGVGGPVGDVDFLVQHLVDPDQGRLGPGQGHHQPADHGQGVHRHTGVVHQAHQLAGQQAGGPENDLPAAEKQDQHAAHPHNAHGNGAGQGKQSPCAQLGLAQVIGGLVKPFGLIPAPNVGLHHPAGHQIFPDGLVHAVHHLQHPFEPGLAHLQQNGHHHRQQRDTRQQQRSQPRRHDKAHHRGQDHHYRRPVQGHQRLTHGVPQGVDVRGGPGDQLRGGDVVDVGKGKALDLPQQGAAHVPGKALGGDGRAPRRQHAHGHGQAGYPHHDGPHRQHKAAAVGDKLRGKPPLKHEGILPVQAAVHNGGHQHRHQQLQHHFGYAENQRRRRPSLIVPQYRAQMPEKSRLFLCLDKTSPLFLLCRELKVIRGYYTRCRRVSQAEKFHGFSSARIPKIAQKCCKP